MPVIRLPDGSERKFDVWSVQLFGGDLVTLSGVDDEGGQAASMPYSVAALCRDGALP